VSASDKRRTKEDKRGTRGGQEGDKRGTGGRPEEDRRKTGREQEWKQLIEEKADWSTGGSSINRR